MLWVKILTSFQRADIRPLEAQRRFAQPALQEGGREEAATFTSEGKDGKITLLAQIISMPDKQIRLAADSFAEKK